MSKAPRITNIGYVRWSTPLQRIGVWREADGIGNGPYWTHDETFTRFPTQAEAFADAEQYQRTRTH